MSIRHFAFAALIASASASQAQVIFSDNFNADLRGLNKTTFVGGWTVGSGTVDVIGSGPGGAADANGYDFVALRGNGNYIDLDGSGIDSGAFTKALTLTGGTMYTASFQLAGSQRNFKESVVVNFGTTAMTYSYDRDVGFTTSVLTFTPTTTGTYMLTFNEPGVSNLEGLLLDNVTVSAVPEPATAARLFAGIASVGFIARRRRFDR